MDEFFIHLLRDTGGGIVFIVADNSLVFVLGQACSDTLAAEEP